MSILLIGYRGCGKTTIGRKLADRLWQPFVDTDDLVVQKAGKSIKDIFEQDGEPHFRDLESVVLIEALGLQDVVLSLGGGAVLREANRRAIRASGHKVIYLRSDPATLHRRIQEDAATASMRPALTALGGTEEEVAQVLAQREPLYRQTMTAELEVTHLTPEEAVVYIVRLM